MEYVHDVVAPATQNGASLSIDTEPSCTVCRPDTPCSVTLRMVLGWNDNRMSFRCARAYLAEASNATTLSPKAQMFFIGCLMGSPHSLDGEGKSGCRGRKTGSHDLRLVVVRQGR